MEETKQYYYPHYDQRSYEQVVEALKVEFAGAKFVGFDKRKTSRPKKSAGYLEGVPARPSGPGTWLAVAATGGLAMGWLLGSKARPALAPPAA